MKGHTYVPTYASEIEVAGESDEEANFDVHRAFHRVLRDNKCVGGVLVLLLGLMRFGECAMLFEFQ